jgi:hypothetical protein
VRTMLELLQLELARYLCITGAPHLQAIDRTMVKTHRA